MLYDVRLIHIFFVLFSISHRNLVTRAISISNFLSIRQLSKQTTAFFFFGVRASRKKSLLSKEDLSSVSENNIRTHGPNVNMHIMIAELRRMANLNLLSGEFSSVSVFKSIKPNSCKKM